MNSGREEGSNGGEAADADGAGEATGAAGQRQELERVPEGAAMSMRSSFMTSW